MESVRSALPELEAVGHEHETTPGGRTRHGPASNWAVSEATASSRVRRSAMTSLWCEACAPIWLALEREAK